MREHADDDRMEAIAEALDPPNRWDAVRRAPAWWTSEDDAWAEFQGQMRS